MEGTTSNVSDDFGGEDMRLDGGGRRMRWNRWWTLSAAGVGSAFVGLLTICLVYSLAGDVPFSFGMVFDAGSTHTEMLLYNWQGDKWRDTGIVRELDTCEMKGGIGTLFSADPSGVGAYLDPCLQSGKAQIPQLEHADSPVFLAATAGLRMLQLEDPVAVDHILGNVSKKLSTSGLRFRPGDARVISGQQEAVSGWVTVNYLSNKLLPGVAPHKLGETLGALDLGGASTQISFETTAGSSDQRVSLQLYGQKYEVTALSYMCYGVAQVILRHQVSLLAEVIPLSTDPITNPCHALGSMREFNAARLRTACSDTNYLSKFGMVTFQGSSNGTLCLEEIRKVLRPDVCKANFIHGNCIEVPPPARTVPTSFVGFSNFFYAASGFNSTVNTTSEQFLNKVKAVCDLPIDKLNTTVFPEVGERFRSEMCYEGLYMFVLLKEVYNFTEEEWGRISYAKTINNTSVGWSLGFMIENTNAIPPGEAYPGMPAGWFVVLVLMFVGLVGAAMWCGLNALKLTVNGSMAQTHPTSYGTLA